MSEQYVKLKNINDVIMVRYLKTQPMYRPLNRGYKIVPKLLICGNWLERAGFLPNQYVSISVMGNTLIIRRAENIDTITPSIVPSTNKCKGKSDE